MSSFEYLLGLAKQAEQDFLEKLWKDETSREEEECELAFIPITIAFQYLELKYPAAREYLLENLSADIEREVLHYVGQLEEAGIYSQEQWKTSGVMLSNYEDSPNPVYSCEDEWEDECDETNKWFTPAKLRKRIKI